MQCEIERFKAGFGGISVVCLTAIKIEMQMTAFDAPDAIGNSVKALPRHIHRTRLSCAVLPF